MSYDFKIGMISEAREVRLRPKIRKVLEARCRAPSTPQGDLKRAQIVLLAAEGRSTRSIAKEVGVQPRIVSKWRHRFADHGLAGLDDCPRASKKPIYSQATIRRILALLEKPPPPGYARWTGPLLASPPPQALFSVSMRSLRSRRWSGRKAAFPKLPNGRALTGQSHDYKRHGTTTLFAALEVASGRIVAEHSKRRRRNAVIDRDPADHRNARWRFDRFAGRDAVWTIPSCRGIHGGSPRQPQNAPHRKRHQEEKRCPNRSENPVRRIERRFGEPCIPRL